MSASQTSLLDVLDRMTREAHASRLNIARPSAPEFHGETFDAVYDFERLDTQLSRVYQAMKGGGWWTLRELAHAVSGSEAGVSARIRDLKNNHGYAHNKRRKGNPKDGVWEYQLLVTGRGR